MYLHGTKLTDILTTNFTNVYEPLIADPLKCCLHMYQVMHNYVILPIKIFRYFVFDYKMAVDCVNGSSTDLEASFC